MTTPLLLDTLNDVQKLLLSFSNDIDVQASRDTLIFGNTRKEASIALKKLQKENNYPFEFIIPYGVLSPFSKPSIKLKAKDNLIGDYGDFYNIDKSQIPPVARNYKESIRLALLRILGMLSYYSTSLEFEHPTYPITLDLSNIRKQAEDLNLIRKPDEFSTLRNLLDTIQNGEENMIHLPVQEESLELSAWILFTCFPEQQQQAISQRCKVEAFGDINSDQYVGFRAVLDISEQAEEQQPVQKTEQKTGQLAQSDQERILETLMKPKNILTLLEDRLKKAQEEQDEQQIEMIMTKQNTITWVLDFIQDKHGVEMTLNRDDPLPKKDISYEAVPALLSDCKHELQRMGIELVFKQEPFSISFYRENPDKKLQILEGGDWLFKQIEQLHEKQKDKKEGEYFDVFLSKHPELVKALVTDDRLSDYIQQKYPGIICYYMMQTNFEVEHDIFPTFFRVGDKIATKLQDDSLSQFVTQLQEDAESSEIQGEYILTGLLQFDWMKNFFDKVNELRCCHKSMGFEHDPNVVLMIKTQPLVKKLIEKRCNVIFLSMDDDFELSENEAISFSVNKTETSVTLGSNQLISDDSN